MKAGGGSAGRAPKWNGGSQLSSSDLDYQSEVAFQFNKLLKTMRGAAVRVTIGHREETAGIGGQKRNYFVDCEVLFSEEEQAIIRNRGLSDNYIVAESATPTGSGIPDYTLPNTALRTLARLCVVATPILFVIAGTTGNGGLGFFSLALPFIAFGIFVFRKVGERKSNESFAKQNISVHQLLLHPHFTVYAPNPVLARSYDDDIRDQLSTLKNLMVASADIRTKETFEL
jgi:hypothetical protein